MFSYSRLAIGAMVSIYCAGGVAAKIPENAVHPAYDLKVIPMPAQYINMGLAFLPDGRMVFATGYIEDGRTNTGEGSAVLVASGVGGDMANIKVDALARNFINPSGLLTVGEKIYLADRDGFYEILSSTDYTHLQANRKKILSWPFPMLWHQWVFTPMMRGDGWFYAPYSGSIKGGGPSDAEPSSPYSGAFLRWNLAGTVEKWAGGLRSPNGANIDRNGNMFVADNQGSWLPSSTFAHIKQGRFYGHKQNPGFAPNWAESLPYHPPTAWLPHGVVRSSPGQPISIDKGTYAGQWLQGDANGTGLLRIALDSVDGDYQGAVFWFTNGTSNSALNRLAWGPDGGLYMGTCEKMGNWPGNGLMPMYKLTPKPGVTAFEMLAIRSIKNGFEIEFTRPVDKATAVAGNVAIKQWQYVRQSGYGAGKGPEVAKSVTSVSASEDGKRLTVMVNGLETDRLTYFKLANIKSATGEAPWDNEAWYTMNKMNPGTVANRPGNIRVASPDWASKAVMASAGGGRLRADLDLEGPYALELRRLDGSLAASGKGDGPGRLVLDAGRPGVYVATVRCNRGSFARKLAL